MNQSQFITLINENRNIIHKICRLYRDSPEDREDLFQEITFQLWKGLPGFRGEAKVSTWIYRIALNTAIATFRKHKPGIVYSEILPDLPDEQPDEEPLLRQQRLFTALKQLDGSEKAIITLYLDELTYRQIAEITGISENNVGVRLNRIKAKLQKLLNK